MTGKQRQGKATNCLRVVDAQCRGVCNRRSLAYYRSFPRHFWTWVPNAQWEVNSGWVWQPRVTLLFRSSTGLTTLARSTRSSLLVSRWLHLFQPFHRFLCRLYALCSKPRSLIRVWMFAGGNGDARLRHACDGPVSCLRGRRPVPSGVISARKGNLVRKKKRKHYTIRNRTYYDQELSANSQGGLLRK